MAALTSDQVIPVFKDTGCRKQQLFQILNVDTSDTIDMASLGHFRIVSQTAWMGVTVTGVATGSITPPATCTAPASLTDAGCYLLVDGVPVTP